MSRSPSTFRKFSLRSLCAAGAVASLGLPLGWNAYGIGGGAIPSTYTPRESVGAAPSVSLISTSSSSSASAAAVSSGGGGSSETSSQASAPSSPASPHVSSSNEGHGTTASHRPRKSSERTTEKTSRTAKREVYEGKEGKEVKPAPLIAPVSKPIIALSTGFESRYIYHGVDIVGFNSGLSLAQETSLLNNYLLDNGLEFAFPKGFVSELNRAAGQPTSNRTSPVVYINGNIEFKGLHLGVGYLHAIDQTIPSRVAIANEAVTFNRLFNVLGFDTPFAAYNKTRTYYQEVDVNLDYTLSIVANILDATVGYNSYIIPNHEFKGTNYQGEAFGRLTYKQIPYVQPSITYYRYISDGRAETVTLNTSQNAFIEQKRGEYLNGNYVEARLDGAYPLFTSPGFSAAFGAYGLVSLNDGYLTKQVTNTTTTEFNTAEVGAKLPLTVGGQFSITPYVNYGFDISRTHTANDFRGVIGPFKEDVWGGVTFSYRF